MFSFMGKLPSPKHMTYGPAIFTNPCTLGAALVWDFFRTIAGKVGDMLPDMMKPSRATVDAIDRYTFAGSLFVTSAATVVVGGIAAVAAICLPGIACADIPPVLQNLAMKEAMAQSTGLFTVAGCAMFCGLLGLENFVGLFIA